MIFHKKANSDSPRDFVLKKELNTEYVGQNLYYFDVTDSTNNEAKKHFDLPDGTVFVAEKQTAGRGRKGRNWESGSDGLWFSILLKPDIEADKIPQITLIAGLAVAESIPGSLIKWPNDIVMGNKKLAGILTEMSVTNSGENYVITGIGININTKVFPQEISDVATSLYIQTGKLYSKEEVLAKFCEKFEYRYKIFLEKGFSACLDEYSHLCVTINREVVINNFTETYSGFASGIDNNGELIVKTQSGETKVLSGEVSVRGLFGYV